MKTTAAVHYGFSSKVRKCDFLNFDLKTIEFESRQHCKKESTLYFNILPLDKAHLRLFLVFSCAVCGCKFQNMAILHCILHVHGKTAYCIGAIYDLLIWLTYKQACSMQAKRAQHIAIV